MSQVLITYEDFKEQSDNIQKYLESDYWEINSNEKTATMKPRFSNLPNKVEVSGLTNTNNLSFDGNAISLGSGAASSVTISGNNFEHKKAIVSVTSQTNCDISVSDICFNGGAYADVISLSSGAADCTILGGQGQDTIYNNDSDNRHVFQIKNNNGHKVLRGYTSKDSIQIMDDSTFVPTVFSPANSTDYFPFTIGNVNVSLQGNLVQVPCVNILNKDGNLISSNTVGNGVIFKSPDITITESGQRTTVQGCNCSVTGTAGSDSIFCAYGGVTINTIYNAEPDYIYNSNDSDYGNTYIFSSTAESSNANTSSIVGFNHNVDTLVIAGSGAKFTQDITSPVSVTADGACNTIDLGMRLRTTIYKTKSYKITTQSAFYDDTFTFVRDNDGTITNVTVPAIYYYSTKSLFTNEHIKTLNSTSTAALINKRADAVISHAGNATILPEGSGSSLTCTGTATKFLIQSNNCSVQGSSANENFTVDGNNNYININNGGADTISVASGAVNNIFNCFNNNANVTIYNNGEGNVFQASYFNNGTTTVYNFNKNKDSIWTTSAASKITFEAVSGGTKINIKQNVYKSSYFVLPGVYSGDVINCRSFYNNSPTDSFTITVSY